MEIEKKMWVGVFFLNTVYIVDTDCRGKTVSYSIRDYYSCWAINFLIVLTHAINYFNHALINASVWKVYLCRSMMPLVDDYTNHTQDVTTVELAIKQFYYLVNWKLLE